jgi:hypothetical protein
MQRETPRSVGMTELELSPLPSYYCIPLQPPLAICQADKLLVSGGYKNVFLFQLRTEKKFPLECMFPYNMGTITEFHNTNFQGHVPSITQKYVMLYAVSLRFRFLISILAFSMMNLV